ncbi:MAG: tetratricopeptide repeat protein [Alphaproteobacteria bacterium]|nr:tetratricopeptide repeat protein [Alphaproteobacteria bacterium]
MPYERGRKIGLVVAAILGAALFAQAVHGQDAAWEGLINAGRNALQQQNFSEAERHFESALEAAERFPSGDARLGKSYNNLAAVYYAQEDYARAEPLMRRALAQLREALGPENTDVAQTMKNLAALYYLQGNRSEAEALLKQSLEILENVHGPNHAFVATVLSNLAGLYQAEDRFQEAEPLLTRSLTIWESLLGSDHPDVVRSRSLLAQVREARGGQGLGTEAATINPRALTPLASTEARPPSNADTAAEIEKAANALEQLTRASRAEAERAQAEGVPVPALSPIDGLVNAEVDAAASPQAGATIGALALGPVDAAQDQTATAAAIVNEAPSADDVSFSIYLSTLWSVDEAQRYWRALQNAVPDVLGDKHMEIEEVTAEGGGEPFYRVLTAPFVSDPEARTACEQIKSKLRTHDCNVVVRDKTAEG